MSPIEPKYTAFFVDPNLSIRIFLFYGGCKEIRSVLGRSIWKQINLLDARGCQNRGRTIFQKRQEIIFKGPHYEKRMFRLQ